MDWYFTVKLLLLIENWNTKIPTHPHIANTNISLQAEWNTTFLKGKLHKACKLLPDQIIQNMKLHAPKINTIPDFHELCNNSYNSTKHISGRNTSKQTM